MRRTLALTTLVIAILAAGVATPVHADSSQLKCSGEQIDVNVDRSIALFNENTEVVPEPVAAVASSNTTEIRITNASEPTYTVSFNDSLKITTVDVGPATDPDVTVTTNQSTACDIHTADDPVSVAQEAYHDDRIHVEGNGVVNQAKTGVVDVAIDIIRFFYRSR